jgi:hypothetical protein
VPRRPEGTSRTTTRKSLKRTGVSMQGPGIRSIHEREEEFGQQYYGIFFSYFFYFKWMIELVGGSGRERQVGMKAFDRSRFARFQGNRFVWTKRKRKRVSAVDDT